MLKNLFLYDSASPPQRPVSNIRCVFFQTGRQTFLRECPAAPPRSSERTSKEARRPARPSGRETSVRHSNATASPPLPACLPTHDSGSSCKAARLALGGNAKLPQGAVTPASQPCCFAQRLQAGCCGGIKGNVQAGRNCHPRVLWTLHRDIQPCRGDAHGQFQA